jgi:hypothetical protein
VGGTHFQRSHDLLQHCLSFPKNLIVPEAEHLKSLSFDSNVAALVITSAVLMLSPIEFNGKLRFQTCEVGDESGNRHLSPEPVARELPAAQIPPKVALSIRCSIA